MIKELLEELLKERYIKSNLNASFCEIETPYSQLINLGLYPKGNIKQQQILALNKSLEIFNQIFDKDDEPIWVLINEWDIYPTDYNLSQFSNLNQDNSCIWNSWDETNEVDRQQVFIIIEKAGINIINIFQAIINAEYDLYPQISCRIHFIHSKKHLVFMMWDSCVEISSINPIISDYSIFYISR